MQKCDWVGDLVVTNMVVKSAAVHGAAYPLQHEVMSKVCPLLPGAFRKSCRVCQLPFACSAAS